MRTARRVTALLGGGLLATSLATGTAQASTDTANAESQNLAPNRYSCQVHLREYRDTLWVHIRSNTRNEAAAVRANFNQGPDQARRVYLGRDGDAVTQFRVPNRANAVQVRVHIDRDRGRDVTCSNRLWLR